MSELTIKQNIGDRICLELGAAIVLGKFASHQQLPTEHDICKMYNVSRTVAREAIKMLTAKGLVTARTRKGTIVTEQSHWNLLDPDVLRWLQEANFSYKTLIEFTQMRIAIEPAAVDIIANNLKNVDVAPIATAIAKMEAASMSNQDMKDADIEFHVSIVNATNNMFFQQLAPLIKTSLHFSIQLTMAHRGIDVESHRLVYENILAGRAARARKIMRVMLEEVLELILKAQSQQLS